MNVSVDSSEVVALAAALGRIPARAVPAVNTVVSQSADDLAAAWAANATVSAGDHGKHYPKSITADQSLSAGMLGRIEYVVGPDTSMPQGGMGRGFEYGSVNQPPHLDGTRAADALEPTYIARLSTALAYVLAD